jgi:RNA polymerase sigma-70 factor (ECF subfamily)
VFGPPDDRALLAAVKGGDEAAFRQLYRRHGGRVYSVARRLVGSPELAEDVAQDAWLRAFKGLASFRGAAAFSTWITGIAIRCALETLRQRRPLTFVDDGPDRISPAPHVELRVDLETALDRIAPGYRAVVVLHDLEGFTHDEIAALLDIEPGTAKSQLSRGRRAVRAWLQAAPEKTGS